MQPIDTVEQRLSVYEQALELIYLCDTHNCQMCYIFMNALPTPFDMPLHDFTDFIAPKLVEWWEQKPLEYIKIRFHSGTEVLSSLWFELNEEGRQKRIQVLENAIESCKQKLK